MQQRHWITALFFFAFLGSCNNQTTKTGEVETINVATAFENQTELKASDCFSEVRYVVLETSDSCLIGDAPLIRIASDRIIVMTAQQQCLAFDKQTGKYLHAIGHIGDDPEACGKLHGWFNDLSQELYFPSNRYREMAVYDLNNRFIRTQQEVLTPPRGSICLMEYDYWDKETLLVHTSATSSTPDQIAFIRDTSVLSVHSTRCKAANEHTPQLGIRTDMLSIATNGTGGHTLHILLDDGNSSLVMRENSSPFWHFGKETFFKGNFNDTIYQVTTKGLLPKRVLDLGSYHWDINDRYFRHKDKGFYPLDFLESKEILLFRFCKNLYHDKERKAYNAIYNKNTKEIKVTSYEKGITDDLHHFLPLQPVTSNAQGEFAQLIQPDEIISWMNEQPQKRELPHEIEALRNVKEDDNPVIIIMK